MHYILNRVVVPGGNEYFLPPELVILFVGRFSRGGDVGKRASCFRLCQRHGPLPLTAAHLRDIGIVEGLTPKVLDQSCSAVSETRIDACRVIGRRKDEL